MNLSLIEQKSNFLKQLSKEKKDMFFSRILSYEKIFLAYQKVHNISGFKSLEKEILDSIKVLDFKDLTYAKNIVDVGSGAGFPAIFLAFLLEADFYLFEPNSKKNAFLFLLKSELKLKNLSIQKSKIQDSNLNIKADVISSRALMPVKELVNLCVNFCDKNTIFALYKGSKIKDELKGCENYELFSFEDKRIYCFLHALI